MQTILYVYDLDGTLILQDDVKTSMSRFKRQHGYLPKMNWLKSSESLVDVQFNPIMHPVVHQSNSYPGSHVCLISNRSDRLLDDIKLLMKKLKIRVDDYLLKAESGERPLKSQRLIYEVNKLMCQGVNLSMVYVYDDDPRCIADYESVRSYMQSLVTDYTVVHVHQ